MPSIRQPPPGPIHVHGAVQNSKVDGICLPPPMNQSTPALVSSILPQSSSDWDTDQGDIKDEAIKQVAQSVYQMLLKTSTGNSTSNITPSDFPHDMTLDRQSIPNLSPNDIHTQMNAQPTHIYRAAASKDNVTHQIPLNTKQIVMDIDALSHSPTLHDKILQELKLNRLWNYDNTHKAYLFENSNQIVNCSYILVFKKINMLYHHIRFTSMV